VQKEFDTVLQVKMSLSVYLSFLTVGENMVSMLTDINRMTCDDAFWCETAEDVENFMEYCKAISLMRSVEHFDFQGLFAFFLHPGCSLHLSFEEWHDSLRQSFEWMGNRGQVGRSGQSEVLSNSIASESESPSH
jgi:hypothetical protein